MDAHNGAGDNINAEPARHTARPQAPAQAPLHARLPAPLQAPLPAAVQARYIVQHARPALGASTAGRTEYRFLGDSSKIAFTESSFELATDTNSRAVAHSMIDVAKARGWSGLRLSGSEDFRRLVWLEAMLRGVNVVGYEPRPDELQLLQRERSARQAKRVAQRLDAPARAAPDEPHKTPPQGGARRQTVLAAIEAVLIDKGVARPMRQAVLAAATEQLAQRAHGAQLPRVRLYDPLAPSRPDVQAPAREVPHAAGRSARAPSRFEPFR